MENYGMTKGSDQKEWGKMEPLAEPTPSNVKNSASAERRRRQRDHGRDTETGGGGDNARDRHEDKDRQNGEERSDESENEEVRRAMAEAIWEMEREGEMTAQATA
jgi:hypothetical protein